MCAGGSSSIELCTKTPAASAKFAVTSTVRSYTSARPAGATDATTCDRLAGIGNAPVRCSRSGIAVRANGISWSFAFSLPASRYVPSRTMKRWSGVQTISAPDTSVTFTTGSSRRTRRGARSGLMRTLRCASTVNTSARTPRWTISTSSTNVRCSPFTSSTWVSPAKQPKLPCPWIGG